jgi:hypothetical protein
MKNFRMWVFMAGGRLLVYNETPFQIIYCCYPMSLQPFLMCLEVDVPACHHYEQFVFLSFEL